MANPSVKIYGERHTGTNYLTKLIELNLSVDIIPGVVPQFIMDLQNRLPGNEMVRDIYFKLTFINNLGWKHMLVKPAKTLRNYSFMNNNVSFVTLTRNPYSWLLSLHDKPYHQYYSQKPGFETFLTSPWLTVGREGAPKALPNPVELWNIKNSAYLQLKSELPVLAVKFEGLLDNPRRTLELISEAFSLSWKVESFINHEKSTKHGDRDYWFYRDYYLNEKWKSRLTPSVIAIINERIDHHLMNAFGYERLG